MQLLLLIGSALLGALALGVWGGRRWAPELNILASLLTFLAAAALAVRVVSTGPLLAAREQFFVDPFNVFLVTLTAFVGLTTAVFSRPYMRIEMDHGRVNFGQLRLYHGMYQVFMATMLIALTTNNMGLLWVAMEAATLSTVLLVTLYRTPASLEAGWKYFILCGVGIAQALFGTILLYFAAERVLGAEGVTALLWTHLNMVKGQLEPTVLGLAFVFLLVGYGTKVGLAPLHNWLPDAHAEGPTPISAVLSGLLLNVAVYAVVRCKVLVEGSLHSALPSQMLMGFGLLSVVLAGFFLWRQRDVKRLFAYSSIEHMGIVTFAFGMGGPVANFAALLHMTVHSLTKSAIFFAVGHAAQKAGSQLMENIRGLITLSPTVGWGLMVGSLAILGMPPFGVFASEFLILTTAMREHPWATPILVLALTVAFAAIFRRVQPMVFGETTARRLPHPPALLPVFAHLAIVLLLGLYVPPYLADWYRAAARLIGGADVPLGPWTARGQPYPGAPGLRGLSVSREEWRTLATDVATAGGRLLCLWASGADPRGSRLQAAFLVERACLVATLAVDRDVPYPALDDLFAGAARMQRAIADLSGLHSTASDRRPWLRHAAWPDSYHPLVSSPREAPQRTADSQPARDDYGFVRVEGDGVHEIAVGPVHAGIIEPGHFRFSVVGEKVLRLEERLGYVHKGVELRFTQLPILQGHYLAARLCGDSAVAYSWAYCQALEGMSGVSPPQRAVWLRALLLELERLANHLGDLGALGNDAGFAFGLAQFSRLKEQLLRANQAVFAERYLMNAVVPGGTRRDLNPANIPGLLSCIGDIAREALTLRAIYDEHEGVRDRFSGAGRVDRQLARRLGLTGLAGRASGQAFDLRVDLPCAPYAQLSVRKQGRAEGDVAARVAVRFEELQESCRLATAILRDLPDGEHLLPVPAPLPGAAGAGLIEGWRGPVWIALEAGAAATIRRCHPHDPSWHNWPVLEHAIMDNIVPDFPLINKSFNLAYSGHDL